MFHICILVNVFIVLCQTNMLAANSDVKCYSCYQETCPTPWNPKDVQQIITGSGWCLTFSKDNQTNDSTYARNWALPGDCQENKCEWRTSDTTFYVCCCNTNLCNGVSRSTATPPMNGKIKLISNVYFTLLLLILVK